MESFWNDFSKVSIFYNWDAERHKKGVPKIFTHAYCLQFFININNPVTKEKKIKRGKKGKKFKRQNGEVNWGTLL